MITSTTNPEGQHIILSRPLDSRSKKLQLFYAGMHFIAAFGFLLIALVGVQEIKMRLLPGFFGVVFLFVVQRFLNKAIESEQIVVKATEMQLITSGFLRFRVRKYLLSGISNFTFAAPPPLSRHPLAENGSDLLGFQGNREIINHMHGHNYISFDYYGHAVKFGQELSSWDFEQLEILLYDLSANDLRTTIRGSATC